METLKQLAEDGHTVICSIHQPRGSVYSKFDDIVLLSEGEVVYMGPAKEEPLTYFASLGLSFCHHLYPFCHLMFFSDILSLP
jgi:ABC-type multidrug transport system ATPase subunit